MISLILGFINAKTEMKINSRCFGDRMFVCVYFSLSFFAIFDSRRKKQICFLAA